MSNIPSKIFRTLQHFLRKLMWKMTSAQAAGMFGSAICKPRLNVFMPFWRYVEKTLKMNISSNIFQTLQYFWRKWSQQRTSAPMDGQSGGGTFREEYSPEWKANCCLQCPELASHIIVVWKNKRTFKQILREVGMAQKIWKSFCGHFTWFSKKWP